MNPPLLGKLVNSQETLKFQIFNPAHDGEILLVKYLPLNACKTLEYHEDSSMCTAETPCRAPRLALKH
jgi:hypothetical protein